MLVFGIGHPWRPSFSCFSSLSVCLCASLPFSFFSFRCFLSFFSCCSFLLRRVFFLLLFFGPPRPASARRGRACVFFSVVLQFEASARLARLLLAGVVHVCFFLLSYNSKLRPASPGFCSSGSCNVCFFCCPTIRIFGPPRPASARRGRARVFFLLSYNSKLRPASPGFCSPGSCMCVFFLSSYNSNLRPASPGFCSPGSCTCVFSVVLQFESSARLARLLLARVVSVCFCCCPSIQGSAHRARLLLAGVVVPTCCLVVPFLFCSVPDRSFSWGCWGRLCFSQWSPRLVRAHRFLAASLGPGEQWRGPHVAPVASVPRGDAGQFRHLWGLGSGR